jgi:hypothetical protein
MDREDGFLDLIRPENLLLAAFIAVLALAPFPYGANSTWAELALGLGFGGILFAWSGLALVGFAAAVLPIRRLLVPALCIAAALGWAFVQSTDLQAVANLTGIDLRALAHPIWAMTSAALGHEAGSYISIDPETTRHAIFTSALSIGAFLIAFELARDRVRARALLGGIVVIAFAYAAAAFASVHLHVDMQALFVPDPHPPSDRLSRPFVNANHFATFMTLGAIAGMGLFVETLRQSTVWDRGARTTLRTGIRALGGANLLLLITIAVVTAALLITQSRSGVIAFLIGTLALTIALAGGRSWNIGEEAGQRAMTAVLVAALGIAAVVGIDSLAGRVPEQGPSDATRAALADSSMKAIAAAPLAGHGFGAFERYYPLFADGSVAGTVDEANNDLLETLADLGLPAGFAFIAAPMLLAGMCFVGSLRRRRDRMYPAIGFAVSVAVAVHALVEFSLQIPAVAVTYAALLGMGVAQSRRTSMDAVR